MPFGKTRPSVPQQSVCGRLFRFISRGRPFIGMLQWRARLDISPNREGLRAIQLDFVDSCQEGVLRCYGALLFGQRVAE